ncbi:MAG: serine/threonine-protein phosphatase [Chloroflexi bacterium]|nr:serine/threonine-protein phosphatase [Chloroflexota bacterium]
MNKPQLIIAAQTEAKVPGETNNQDAIHVRVWEAEKQSFCGLFIVADGVGGHKKGSLASQTAVETIDTLIDAIRPNIPSDTTRGTQFLQTNLEQAVAAANETILDYAQTQNIRMGSTVTCALVYGMQAIIANIGDSRTYLHRGGRLEQITVDHSVVAWMVRQGHLSAEEAKNHPYSNIIMHALGADETPEMDIFIRTLRPGDKLLLCSDGIWDTLSDEALAEQLNMVATPETAVSHIMPAAQDHSDDLSLIIVQIPS